MRQERRFSRGANQAPSPAGFGCANDRSRDSQQHVMASEIRRRYSRSLMQTLTLATAWFLAHCSDQRKLSPHTLKAYRHDLDHLSAFASLAEGDVPVASIDRSLVRRWLASMELARPRTVRRRLATLKSMFSCLERHGNLSENPLGGFRSEVRVGQSLPRTVARPIIDRIDIWLQVANIEHAKLSEKNPGAIVSADIAKKIL